MCQPDRPPVQAVPACAAIVLAAGASTRLGQPKQLILFEGEPLIRRAARLALDAGAGPVFVIAPAQLAALSEIDAVTDFSGPQQQRTQAYTQALANLPVTILPNLEAAAGMGSSLRLGIAALTAHAPQTECVMLMVCDQPLLRLNHLQALLAAHSQSPSGIAAASFQPHGEAAARPGVPAIFSRAHFPALATANGDQGARTLLRALPITAIFIPEAAVDIDTEEDLRHLDRGN